MARSIVMSVDTIYKSQVSAEMNNEEVSGVRLSL